MYVCVYLCHLCVVCVRPVMCVCLCVGGYSGFVTRDVCAVGCMCHCVICVFMGDVSVCDGCLYVMFVSVCICVMCLYVQCCPVHVVSVMFAVLRSMSFPSAVTQPLNS